jgi:AraC-like DNA-binding protein
MQQSNYPKQFLTLDEAVDVHCSDDPVASSITIHSHNFIEFSYLAEGYGTETINRETFEMRPGYFSIIYPWQTHELHFTTDRHLKYYFVSISMDNFLGAGSVALELKDLFLLSGQNTPSNSYYEEHDYEKLNAAFQEMYAEFTTRKKWWELSVKSKIMDILVLFDRTRNSHANDADVPVHYSGKQTMEILFYIYNNFKEELSLSMLSKYFGLSHNYLSTIIKASLGMTFSDFLQNMRLKYACTLLASTAMPVTDIAYASGYQSYRNFVRFFRKYYTTSPSHFRNMSNARVVNK